MNLNNENILHVKKGDVEYLQFRELLKYSDKLQHAYSLKPLQFSDKNDQASANYEKICKALDIDSNQIIKSAQKHTDVVKDIEEYTDQTLRQLAEETIREKALKLLKDEVPHGIYVEVEKMKQRKNKKGEDIYDIEATIYCLRNSHKGIIIGKNGEMLKRIGRAARIDMEENFGLKVNLKTWVKVKEDWQENESIVKKFKLQ